VGDIKAGTLPQVSWVIAPEACTEHPNWPANYGAWYISQVLDALTSNPELWSRTALFLTYDENDGFFDHMVPATPPETAAQGLSTVAITNEIFPGSADYDAGPYGLEVRVPMIVISPWSKGGYVNAQVFDHTSIIRFIEQRFGAQNPVLQEPNITPWRRVVSGDLTSAFNFKTPNSVKTTLPAATAYAPPDGLRHPDYVPVLPAIQALPQQEVGLRPARALPYEMHAEGTVYQATGSFGIVFRNTGKAGMVFQVRSALGAHPPRSYTVEAGRQLSDTWAIAASGDYDLSVSGPNGFLRAFKGNINGFSRTVLGVSGHYDVADHGLLLTITNRGRFTSTVTVSNRYTRRPVSLALPPGKSGTMALPLAALFGWYDLVITSRQDAGFAWQLAGHVENGRDSVSDPAFGFPGWG